MDNFDLGEALRQYRDREGTTQEEMAKKLIMSRSAYVRLECGEVKPSYERTIKIMEILNIEKPTADQPGPSAPQKWYRLKMWRWVIPIIISFLFLSLLPELKGFREGYGEDQLKSNPPYETFVIIGAIFCAIYWYFWPPEWPFKKPKK